MPPLHCWLPPLFQPLPPPVAAFHCGNSPTRHLPRSHAPSGFRTSSTLGLAAIRRFEIIFRRVIPGGLSVELFRRRITTCGMNTPTSSIGRIIARRIARADTSPPPSERPLLECFEELSSEVMVSLTCSLITVRVIILIDPSVPHRLACFPTSCVSHAPLSQASRSDQHTGVVETFTGPRQPGFSSENYPRSISLARIAAFPDEGRSQSLSDLFRSTANCSLIRRIPDGNDTEMMRDRRISELADQQPYGSAPCLRIRLIDLELAREFLG